MVRVEDLDITFFHLPKNAGSSIANWLTKNVDGEEYMDDMRHASPQSLRPLFDDFGWSFCCVRNPWDRIVSWYNFFKKQGKMPYTFEQYMDKVIAGDYSAKYVKPQSHQHNVARDVDYVIRYENLLEDFKVVQQRVNCFEPLPHSNKSVDFIYKEYYTQDSYINWVSEYYSEEISMFGYKFGE